MRRRSRTNHTVNKKIIMIRLIKEEVKEKEEEEIKTKKKVRKEWLKKKEKIEERINLIFYIIQEMSSLKFTFDKCEWERVQWIKNKQEMNSEKMIFTTNLIFITIIHYKLNIHYDHSLWASLLTCIKLILNNSICWSCWILINKLRIRLTTSAIIISSSELQDKVELSKEECDFIK